MATYEMSRQVCAWYIHQHSVTFTVRKVHGMPQLHRPPVRWRGGACEVQKQKMYLSDGTVTDHDTLDCLHCVAAVAACLCCCVDVRDDVDGGVNGFG